MSRRQRLRIAIDGPSGAGKSTLARALARELGLPYIDTGAMYRALAWKSLAGETSPVAGEASSVTGGGPPAGEGRPPAAAVAEILSSTRLEVIADPDDFRILVDGQDVTDQLRRPTVSERASDVARDPEVRAWMVERQRRLAAAGGVLEGRDIGTVVLPEADVKFFITAPESERIRRRARQLADSDRGDVEADVRDRDRRDATRATSPLRPAADAVHVDTGAENERSSLERLVEHVRRLTGGATGDDRAEGDAATNARRTDVDTGPGRT